MSQVKPKRIRKLALSCAETENFLLFSVEVLLLSVVSSTLRHEKCGKWIFSSGTKSYCCPDSFWRCLALPSDLHIMQKSLTGSTASLFTDCNSIWRDFAYMEATCFFVMWLDVQIRRMVHLNVGISDGTSKQNCCRLSFLEHHNCSSIG